MFLLNKYPALGTLFWIEVFDKELSEEKVGEAAEDIKSFIIDFENKFSRFKKDSLVRLLSREQRVSFDEDFYKMLTLGVSLEQKTKGLFSLFIGNRIIQKGYGSKEFLVPHKDKQSDEESDRVDNEGKDRHTVRREGDHIVIESGDGIDLGGIGKGYLIDLLAKRLEEKWDFKEYLVNGGGDIYATSRNGKSVDIFLEHPLEEGSVLGKIELFHQGFAASSSFKRMWNKEGKEVNHFIVTDEEVWGAVFTVATSAVLADVYTKIVLLSLPALLKGDDILKGLEESDFVPFMLMHESGVYVSPSFPRILPIKV